MSAILDTKKAVEKRLKAAFSTTNISWEGISFKPSADLYLRTQFVIRNPDDPVIGDKYYRERISFQVFVCDVQNKGSSNAFSKAEEIRQLFQKGLTLTESQTHIYILNTPRIQGSIVAEDRLIVPVMIELVAEVFE